MKFLASLLALICLASPVWAGKHALIISNAQYADLSDLRNTHADADAYAEVFAGFGYSITRLRDSGLDETLDTLDVFLSQLYPGDEVAVVFSGHGWSDGQVNYLVPVDAPLQGSDRKLKRETIALKNGADGLLDEIEARNVGLTVAVIDACRDNPFKPPDGRRSAGISRGLAPVTPRTGSFIVYSAGEGQQALDRLPSDPADQKLSVFTRSFVPYLKQGLHLEEAISRAQVDTAALAQSAGGHRQEPAYYDAALGLTCIAGECVSGQAKAASVDRSSEADALLIAALGLPADVQAIALQRIVDGFDGTAAAEISQQRLVVLQQQAGTPQLESEPLPEDDQADPEISKATDPSKRSAAYWETTVQELAVPTGAIDWIQPSPTGRFIVTWSWADEKAQLWDAETGTLVSMLRGHSGGVRWAVYTPDGARIISSSNDGQTFVWDGRTGRSIDRLSSDWGKTHINEVSNDGTTFVTSFEGLIQVWDTESLTEVAELGERNEGYRWNEFSPDDTLLVTGTEDRKVQVWDATTGQEILSLKGLLSPVSFVAFVGDGSRIATVDQNSFAVWEAETGKLIKAQFLFEGIVWSMQSADGSRVALHLNDDTVSVRDAFSGQEVSRISSENLAYSWAISPDGSILATTDGQNRVNLWDIETGTRIADLAGHQDQVLSAAFSHDGAHLFTASADGTVRVWGGE